MANGERETPDAFRFLRRRRDPTSILEHLADVGILRRQGDTADKVRSAVEAEGDEKKPAKDAGEMEKA